MFLLIAIVARFGRLRFDLARTSLFSFVGVFVVFDVLIAILVARFETAYLIIASVAALITNSVVAMSVIALIALFVTIAFRTTLIADPISMIRGIRRPAIWTNLEDFTLLAAFIAISIAPVLLAAFITFLNQIAVLAALLAAFIIGTFRLTSIADAVIVVSVIAFITMLVTIAFRTTLVADTIRFIREVICPATRTRLINVALLTALAAEPSAIMFLSTFLTKFIRTALFNALRLILTLVTNSILIARTVLAVRNILAGYPILAVIPVLAVGTICVHH